MDGPPPPLRLIGPDDNNPNARTVGELRERLRIAHDHPSINQDQRDEIDGALFYIKFVRDNQLKLPPAILLEVEAIPRIEVKEQKKQRGGRKTLRKTRRMRKTLHMRKKTHRKRSSIRK
jgi:hypothetical protein